MWSLGGYAINNYTDKVPFHLSEVSTYTITLTYISKISVQYICTERNAIFIQTTYTHARAHLATLLDEVTANREVVIIQRRGADDVALIAADELASLLATAHLFKSPANAERLLTALARVRARTGDPQSLGELRREVHFDSAD